MVKRSLLLITRLILVPVLFAPLPSIAEQLNSVNFVGWQKDYPPYFYSSNDRLTGISVDILNKAFDSIGYKVNYRFLPTGRLPTKEVADQLDITIQYKMDGAFLGPRSSRFEVSEHSIFSTQLAMFARANSPINIKAIEDLKQYRVGIIRAPQFRQREWRLLGLHQSERHYYSDFHQVLKALFSKRVDLITINPVILNTMMPALGINTPPKRVFSLPDVDSHVAFAVHSKRIDAVALAGEFDRALVAMRERGEVQEIIQRHSRW